MSGQKVASWAYTEDFIGETVALETARARGEQLAATPVLPGTGAALRMLAAACHAKTIVEIGSGAGVSGLWILEGMPADGVLTTIEIEPEHGRAAKSAYAQAGVPANRTRIITGDARDVLPRLTDGAYDMVHVDGDKRDYPGYVEQAIRILRRGGVLAIDNMLWHDKVADPAARDDVTTIIRDLGKSLRDDDRVIPTLLPVGDGLFVAIKR